MQRNAENTLVAEELGREELYRLRAEWDELAARAGRQDLFARHYFLRTWLDNFEPSARLRLFVARAGSRLLAALPLVEDRAVLYGVPLRRLRSPSNVHSNRFDLLADPARPDALPALWSQLCATSTFDLVELRDVAQEGGARALLELAGRDGLSVAAWESMRTPYIPLAGGFEKLWAGLDARFRQNLRRRRRKLEQRGQVEVERVDGGLALERALEEAFAVEQSGWKGEAQTAIGCDPVTRGFYAELAREAALRGELALYLLRLDGRAIAFQLGLVCGSSYLLPKTGYSEEHGDCSPGQLLTEEVLRDCCRRGLAEFDFLGPGMDWKRDWSQAARPHHWLYLLSRNARALAFRELKFGFAPAVKEVLRWRR